MFVNKFIYGWLPFTEHKVFFTFIVMGESRLGTVNYQIIHVELFGYF